MKWLKNFDRLLEIQRSIVWPSVLELDPKQFFPEFLKVRKLSTLWPNRRPFDSLSPFL